MKVSYRIEIRRRQIGRDVGQPTNWVAQTRVKSKRDAELQKALWEARGFEVQIVEER